jgi:hypothetical protein
MARLDSLSHLAGLFLCLFLGIFKLLYQHSGGAFFLPFLTTSNREVVEMKPIIIEQEETAVEKMKSLIPPHHFVDEMEKHWEERLGNISSEALRKVWMQIAGTFGSHIGGFGDFERWTILQPPTGSGKTQGTIVYCKMLSRLNRKDHPGVLIVTRRIDDANQIAEQINELSGKTDEAVAYHSDNKIDLDKLPTFPVLVICHRAYELAMDAMTDEGSKIQHTWPHFYSWQNWTGRKLVVIDEALDIVEYSQAGLDGLRQTLGVIPKVIRDKYPDEIKSIEEAIDLLDCYDNRQDKSEPIREHMVLEKIIKEDKLPDLDALRKEMRTIEYDKQQGKSDALERQRLSRIHDERIKNLNNIFKSWQYYVSSESKPTLNTARLLIPDDVKGAVVLDATANCDLIYKLFNQAVPINPPLHSRNYQNVTLHVSMGHKVGKGYMRSNAKDLSSQLIAQLNEELGEDRKVFFCAHKGVEPVLITCDEKLNPEAKKWMTGHWGYVDGSNKWKDCDTAVIFGLPYRPNTWTANVFMALQGPQSSEWLQDSNRREYGGYLDIRKALMNGQITTSIIQAINRIRCRKVIDDQGNCPKSDVFILLPKNELGEDILDGIRKLMPGIKIKNWDYDSISKRKIRGSNYEPALIKYFETMDIGRVAASGLKKNFDIPNSTFERLIVKMKDKTTELYKVMRKLKVIYKSDGSGRGHRAYIIKEWVQGNTPT